MRLISYTELREGDLIAVLSKNKIDVNYYFVLSILKDLKKECIFVFLLTTTSGVQVKRIVSENQNIFTTKGILMRWCN